MITSTQEHVSRLLEKLEQVKPTGPNKWMASCPLRQDADPSLSVAVNDEGAILLHDFGSDATAADIVASVGLTMQDLYPSTSSDTRQVLTEKWRRTHTASKLDRLPGKGSVTPQEIVDRLAEELGPCAGEWIYHLADGTESFRVYRFESAAGKKQYRPVHHGKNGWVIGDPPIERLPLYRLKHLDGHRRTYVTEGERACDAAVAMGLPATTSAHGSKSAAKSDWASISDHEVVVLPDNDDAGEKYATDVVREVVKINSEAVVRIARLPNLPPGGDVVEFVENNEDVEPDRLTAMVEAMADQTEPEVIEQDIKPAQAAGKAAGPKQQQANTVEFPPIVPIEVTRPDTLPVEVMPAWLGAMVEANAIATETPVGLNATMGLAVTAIACHSQFEIQVARDFAEPLALYTMGVMPPGERKTAVAAAFDRPLIKWQRERAEAVEQMNKPIAIDRDLIERDIKAKKRAAEKATSQVERKNLIAEIVELQENMPALAVAPRILAEDVTAEKLASLLNRYGGAMGVVSDEGAFIKNIAGRYSGSKDANIDLVLKSWSAKACIIDRIRDDTEIFIRRPVLSIGLLIQPSLLNEMSGNDQFVDRGLMDRFIYSIPPSKLGYREHNADPIAASVKAAFDYGISTLLSIPPKSDDPDDPKPHRISMTPEAHQVWHAYRLEIEAAMRPDGELEHCTGYGGKWPGQVARIAGLFHCVQHSDRDSGPHLHEVTEQTMIAAITFARAALGHALFAFDAIGMSQRYERARRILKWIKADQLANFTTREALRSCQNRTTMTSADDVRDGCEVLIDHGFIVNAPAENRIGRPSEKYLVNPAVLTDFDGHPHS